MALARHQAAPSARLAFTAAAVGGELCVVAKCVSMDSALATCGLLQATAVRGYKAYFSVQLKSHSSSYMLVVVLG